MAAEAGSSDTVFLRRASGVVRAMSPVDGMFYGYLSATGIYSYVLILFLGMATFPHANLWLANIISFIFFFFVFATYAFLGASMPRSGGDYVFVSRIVHPGVGFVASMAGWTLWQFFGCFFAASALVNVILSPFFSMIGVATGDHFWITLSNDVTKAWVRLPLVILMIVVAGWVAVNGMSWYVKVQKYFMMPGALIGLLIIIVSLLLVSKSTFMGHFDHFQRDAGGQPSGSVVSLAQSLGFDAPTSSNFTDTACMAVEFSYLYIWTMWSIELFGEVKSASRVRSVFGMFAGSHVLMFITYAVGFSWATAYVGQKFMKSFAWLALNNPDKLGGSWDFRGATTFFYIPTLNIVVGVLLFLCFIGPTSQSLFNTILGSSRLLLAASFDRLLPTWLGKVNNRGVPAISIWIGVALSVAVACTYEVTAKLAELLFWSTFMTLLAMALAMLAGMLLPYRRKSIYDVSPASQYTWLGIPAITICGTIAFLFIAGLCIATAGYEDQFGLFKSGAARAGLITALVVTVGSAIWYVAVVRYRRQQGLELSAAFREIPPA
jgi:basic amino acid/polyamine antiporter, APA family